MEIVPQNTYLGELSVIEIYDYYDFPRLFLCQNLAGQKYLVIWHEESQSQNIWFYLPVSDNRLSQVRSGGIDLHNAVMSVEDGFIYKITIHNRTSESEVETIAVSNINPDLLPMKGEGLELDTETLPMTDNKELEMFALQTRRETIDMSFALPSIHRSEASLNFLGNILKSIQDLMNSIGQSIAQASTERGRIPQEILDRTELSLSGVYSGSFGIRLLARQEVDLFGYSLIGDVFERFMAVLRIKDDFQGLRDRLLELHTRSIVKYRKFLQFLVSRQSAISVKWASPREKGSTFIDLSSDISRNILNVVSQIEKEKPTEFEVTVTLIGLNIRTGSFEIWTTLEGEEREKYSGKISQEAFKDVEHATINENYIAKLREYEELNTLTGETKFHWELISLNPL